MQDLKVCDACNLVNHKTTTKNHVFDAKIDITQLSICVQH